jgi:hypothetical protein
MRLQKAREYKRTLIVVLTVFVIFSVSIKLSRAESWMDPANVLGTRIDSREFKTITKKYGPMSCDTSSRKTVLDFELNGITFIALDDKIIEVLLQIAPGKKIKDIPFPGILPENIYESSESAEKAIQLLGKPVFDSNQGYRQLTYIIDNLCVILYYGPALDYISIKSKGSDSIDFLRMI